MPHKNFLLEIHQQDNRFDSHTLIFCPGEMVENILPHNFDSHNFHQCKNLQHLQSDWKAEMILSQIPQE